VTRTHSPTLTSMESASTLRKCVGHKHKDDNHLPSQGEIIVLRLSQDLVGPGSTLRSASDLPSKATRRNYHHAVVLDLKLDIFNETITLTVLPMPAYSGRDLASGLSSTSWLLDQPVDFQKRHIPVPYEEIPPPAQPHPQFPTPVEFGDPIEVGGWKNKKPSWIQVVPMLSMLKYTSLVRSEFSWRQVLLYSPTSVTQYKCYEPPVKLSEDEFRRLKAYVALLASPESGTMHPSPPGGGSTATGDPDTSPSGKDKVAGGGSTQDPKKDSGNNGGATFGAGGSTALQALYATDAVKQAFANLSSRGQAALILDSDEDDEDDDDDNDDWEDRMDPIEFARYYAAQSPHLAKIVQDHEDKMRGRLVEGVSNWVREIQS
jgi:hypothetical protein